MEHCPTIKIRFIDPNNHRYPTCGDWLYDAEDNILEVRVSRMTDWRSELSVAVHEAVEAIMCLEKDISETDVTAFDLQFEKDRDAGKHSEADEPGDDKSAPYHLPHVAATFVEKEICAQTQLSWLEHEKNVAES